MSLDTYHRLDAAGDPAARGYLQTNFEALLTEAIEKFSLYGGLAVGLAALAVIATFVLWLRLRKRLPWHWAWLLPLVGLTAYASVKSAVVLELIRQAPELPQMWSLFFKYWTPLRMVRTSVIGLVVLCFVMWGVAAWRGRAMKTCAYVASSGEPTAKMAASKAITGPSSSTHTRR